MASYSLPVKVTGMKIIKSVSVFGLGKLGSCIAATLAARGFDVLGIDIDPDKVAKVNAGEPPVEEPLLAEFLAAGRPRLRASVSSAEAIQTDASFFIPPTPSLPDGSFSNEFLLRAMQPVAAEVGRTRKDGHLFVCHSTTTPGALNGVLIPMLERETGGVCGRDFGVCYNPEFIALGNVIRGLLEPDLVLIGESDAFSGGALESVYWRFNDNAPAIVRMSIASAELAKIAVNSFVTMKISFTNQLRMMAERIPGAEIHAILGAIGHDERIGGKYLRAGGSYGGPCFPRDNRLLAYTASALGVSAPLAVATDQVNELAKENLLAKVRALATPDQPVAVLGMAYKPDTYITEESSGLALAQQLRRAGYRVLVHDCMATPENSPSLREFEVLDGIGVLARRPDVKVVVICCAWPQYRSLNLAPGTRLISLWQF